jgi:hypothetical protein
MRLKKTSGGTPEPPVVKSTKGKGSATIMATLTSEDKTAVAGAAQFTVTGAAQLQRFESVSRRQFPDPIELKPRKSRSRGRLFFALDQADPIFPIGPHAVFPQFRNPAGTVD